MCDGARAHERPTWPEKPYERLRSQTQFLRKLLNGGIVKGGFSLSCLYPPLTQSFLILILKIMLDIENFDSFDMYMDYIENIYAPKDVELLNDDDYESGRR